MPFRIPTNLKGILKNKWAMAGLAVAAGAGGFVLYRRTRGGAGGAGGGASTATGVTGTSGGPADTTGTDVATWLGSYSVGLQNMLQEQFKGYGQTLTDALKGITPTTPPPTASNKYPGTPRPTKTVTTKALGGDTWQSIVNRYFSHTGTPTTNAAALELWDKMHGGTGAIRGGGTIHLPVGSPGFV